MSTYEPFKFCYVNSVRDTDSSTVYTTAPTDADHPVDYVRDNRLSTYWKQNAAGTGNQIRWDRGAGFADLPDLTRLIIPAGHNLDGQLRVVMDNDVAYESSTVNLIITDQDSTGPIDLPLTTALSERYGNLIIDGTTTAWEIPLLYLTATYEPATGFDTETMVDEYVSNDRGFPLPGGAEPRLTLGPKQRRIEIEYHRVTGADLGAMELFIDTVGTSEPFWVEPPIFAASAILNTGASAAFTGVKAVLDGGDMPTATSDFTIGAERITGAFLSSTTFTITSRGQAGTTATAHAPGERIVYHPNTGAEHHRARLMKFETMPSSRVQSISFSEGKKKFFRFSMIDHID